MGRFIDAVASIVGVRDFVSFEGQAAMELEALAELTSVDGTVYPFQIHEGQPAVVDTRPTTRAVVADVMVGIAPPQIARRFHSTIVALSVEMCDRICRETRINVVALSGGVFMNAILSAEIAERLDSMGLRVCRHHEVPPNDGGISLGQLAIAAARLTKRDAPQTAREGEANNTPNFAVAGQIRR
jgi:hydrogenase maturation protein HypF